jgi:hypothetical protein
LLRYADAGDSMTEPSDIPQPSQKRIVYAIMIHLGGMKDQSVIVWPDRLPEKPCARLLDSRKSWMTAGRDDIVMLTEDLEHWHRKFITRFELFRVSPAEHIGEIVESSHVWIEAVRKQRFDPKTKPSNASWSFSNEINQSFFGDGRHCFALDHRPVVFFHA